MTTATPFHAGELQVQRRTGEAAAGARNGSVITDTILAGAIPFLAQQPFLVLGSIDTDGAVWASVLFGSPGFLDASDPRRLEIDLTTAALDGGDPLWAAVASDPRVGGLAIELSSRRRLRINGDLRVAGAASAVLEVAECYPNCPKYIHRRHLSLHGNDATDGGRGDARAARAPDAGAGLEGAPLPLIDDAVTFFVASVNAERGLDASHRGGRPGFVRRLGPTTLRVPDYAGNSMFNTLGNLSLDPRAGLLFPDFEQGRLLQLTGAAELHFDQDDPAGLTGGTGRFWDFHVRRWRAVDMPAMLANETLDASPFSPPVG